MGNTGEQPASELVADLLDTARASRARTMQEVAETWQRTGTTTPCHSAYQGRPGNWTP
jgi:hypothetical protein